MTKPTNPSRTGRTLAILVVVAMVALSAGATSIAFAATSVDVSIDPSEQTVVTGETTTFDVVVDGATEGIGALSGTVELTDPSVAEITDISIAGEPGFSSTDVADDGDSATITAAYGGNTLPSGSSGITVATVTVEATAAGETGVVLTQSSAELGDAPGNDYEITSIADATLTVTPQNQPPTADAGDDQTAESGETVTLDGSASSDPDDDDLTYSWSQTGGPDVTLSDATAASPTFEAPDVTESTPLTFELTVDDGTETATDTVSVTVEPLTPADFQVSNLNAPTSATQGETITVSADVTNDGELSGTQTVEFQLDGTTLASEEITLDAGASQTVSLDATVPGDLAAGTYTHGVYTDDDSATAQLTVEEAATEPSPSTAVSLSPSDQSVGVGDVVTYDVVVENAQGGVGAIDLTVSVEDSSVAELVDIEAAGATQGISTDISGSSASIEAYGLDTDDSGTVTVATVTLDTAAVDTTSLSLDVTALGTEDGTDYAVTGTNGASLTVESVSFLVSDLDAPASVVRGESVAVSGTVTNDGAVETTKSVEFRFDLNGDGTIADDEVVDAESVTLGAGESQTVSFEGDVPADLTLGEYDHGVFTVDDSATGTIEVTLPKLDENYVGPPQDLDGNGLFEDVNGNGEFNLVDVQALFANRESSTVTDNAAQFDFSGNGAFDLVDVQRLFAIHQENN